MKATLIAAFFLILATPSYAQNKVLLSCGDLSGNSFFMAGGIVPKDAEGWKADSISPGRTLLIANAKGAVIDVKSQDAAGWFSYANDGCSVTPVKSGKDGSFIVIAVCPLSVDTFMFLNNGGRPKLIFSQLKSAPAITKGTTMVSNCRNGE